MNNELYHFGILGQKWGVRRYQNPDGTLTNAGKKRQSNSNKSNKSNNSQNNFWDRNKKSIIKGAAIVAGALAALSIAQSIGNHADAVATANAIGLDGLGFSKMQIANLYAGAAAKAAVGGALAVGGSVAIADLIKESKKSK